MKLIEFATAFVLVAACNKTDSPAPPVAATVEAAAPAPSAPFTGTLTPAMILSADHFVKPFQPWDEAFAQLQGKLGKPTATEDKDGKTAFVWAAAQGDDCAVYRVDREDGAKYHRHGMMVGTVSQPEPGGKTSPPGNRADCLRAAGKGPVDDPSVAGPSGDHAKVGEVLANAPHAKAKWDGKQLAITGTVKQRGSQTDSRGKEEWIELADASDPSLTLTVGLAPGVDDVAAKVGKPATYSCTVKVQDDYDIDTGTPSRSAVLEACAVTSAPQKTTRRARSAKSSSVPRRDFEPK